MGDLYSFVYLPYALTFWVSAAYCGPALGPLLSGFAVSAKGWRWSLWEILWIAGPAFLAFFFFLPETSGPNILARRAQRLRQKTGDPRLQSQSEIDQKNLRVGAILVDAIIKPLEISVKDPAVAFTNLYTAIVYGIYYSFFEAFPLVYPPMYGFNLGEVGVAFICIVIACALGVAVYCAYVYWVVTPDMMKNGLGPQEGRLKPALIAVFFPTLGLFLFGWTARPSIHWIASIIGITLYGAGVFVLLQCMFLFSQASSLSSLLTRGARYLPLHPPILPQIRCLPLRCQRLRSFGIRLRFHPIRTTHVRQPRHREGYLPPRWPERTRYNRNIHPLLLRCEIES